MAVRSWMPIAVFLLLLLCLEIPVLSTSLPPLIDYPNHLARMQLLTTGGDAFWSVRWRVLPNLAEDGFVWSLAGALPVELAARAFLVLTVAIDAIGAVLIARALQGAFRPWSLLALLFVWSASLLWGFLNYSFGLGLALISAAAWLSFDLRPALRALVAIPIALAIWFAHIEAFAIYAILVVGFEVQPCLAKAKASLWRDAIGGALSVAPQFVIPLGLSVFVWHANAAENWELSGLWRKPDLILTAFANYSGPLDVLSLILVLCLFGGLLFRRRLIVVPRAIPALLLLGAAFLASPNHLYSGGGADHRLPAVILILFFAASAPRFRTRSEAAWIYGSALALFLARICVLEYSWLGAQRTYARDLEILDLAPRGATIAVGQPVDAIKFSAAPELHMPLMATVRRDAFVPTLFAYPEQQPIEPTPRGAALRAVASENALWSAFVDRDPSALAAARPTLAQFDYLVLVGRRPFQVPADAALTPIGETPTFKFFAVEKAGGS